MTYKINGVEFIIQPTYGQWVTQTPSGIDGNGHPIYPAIREFEIKWNLNSPSGTYQLQQFFAAITITGTAVVDLPKYAHSEYTFYSYSGCVVHQPEFGNYFAEYVSDVVLLVSKIRT